jgi:hypothetical protein
MFLVVVKKISICRICYNFCPKWPAMEFSSGETFFASQVQDFILPKKKTLLSMLKKSCILSDHYNVWKHLIVCGNTFVIFCVTISTGQVAYTTQYCHVLSTHYCEFTSE